MGENNRLTGKRILFLSASFFGYQHLIKEQMEHMGAIVDLFDERPANSVIVKALIRINPKLIKIYIDNYHNKIIKVTAPNKYDYVLIIKAESISLSSLEILRSQHKEAKFILYLWDNFDNFVDGTTKVNFFDKVLTFDKNDAVKYKLHFRPLFYIPQYGQVSNIKIDQDIDLLFVGTIHSDRYQFLDKIKIQVEQLSQRYYYYMFFMSPILYYKMKLKNIGFRRVKKNEFKFKPLSQPGVLDLFSRSKVIIDIQHPKQTGLTMRTIETIGAGRKLITTNETIVNYDFYDPANILIVDRIKPSVDMSFFSKAYKEIAPHVLRSYSLEYWIIEVLS